LVSIAKSNMKSIIFNFIY